MQHNDPHHRAAAKRPELQRTRGRRLRVHVVVMPSIEHAVSRMYLSRCSDKIWRIFLVIGDNHWSRGEFRTKREAMPVYKLAKQAMLDDRQQLHLFVNAVDRASV
jgi:hypothetical protein